jgi:hypothetical protein
MVAEFGGKFSLTTLSYETKRYVHVLCYQDVPVLNAPTAPYKAAIPSIPLFIYPQSDHFECVLLLPVVIAIANLVINQEV